MKIENRQQFLIVLTIAVAALFVGDRLVFEPLAKWWKARAVTVAGLRQQVADGKNLIKGEASLRRQWSDMNASALTNNTSLAENQLISALNGWSRGSGAEITSIMPQWKYDSTNYWTLNCRLEASGTLQNLSQFIYSIESGQAALKVDSVELAAHDTAGQQITLGLQISGLALLQPTKPTTQVKR